MVEQEAKVNHTRSGFSDLGLTQISDEMKRGRPLRTQQ